MSATAWSAKPQSSPPVAALAAFPAMEKVSLYRQVASAALAVWTPTDSTSTIARVPTAASGHACRPVDPIRRRTYQAAAANSSPVPSHRKGFPSASGSTGVTP